MGKHGLPKQFGPLVDAALALGWTLEWGKHAILRAPDGGQRIIVSMSPRTPDLAARQLRRDLRKAGVDT